jgi:hypothetical protein
MDLSVQDRMIIVFALGILTSYVKERDIMPPLVNNLVDKIGVEETELYLKNLAVKIGSE